MLRGGIGLGLGSAIAIPATRAILTLSYEPRHRDPDTFGRAVSKVHSIRFSRVTLSMAATPAERALRLAAEQAVEEERARRIAAEQVVLRMKRDIERLERQLMGSKSERVLDP